MLFSELIQALPTVLSQSGGDTAVTAVEQDSRKVAPGAVFVARRGGQTDGAYHIPAALERGAAAIVGEGATPPIGVPYVQVPDAAEALAWLCAGLNGFPARKLVMIGVTGTDGKTTTCNLIHSILKSAGIRAGLISTVNAVIGEKMLDTGLHTTTPDAPDVQSYLAQMVAAGLTHCVLETTSHGLVQGRVTGCEFDIAVLTNITHEHLDFHGSFEAYRSAKAKLFTGLATAARKPGVPKLAVLNADDPSSQYLAGLLEVPRLTYSLRPGADVCATDVHLSAQGLLFRIDGQPVTANLLGEYNVSNCLAAWTAALGLGLGPDQAAAGIAALPGVVGRMEAIELGQDFSLIVDFAHTPNALEKSLQTARRLAPDARVVAVFGSAGLRDRAKRRMMGEAAGRLADWAILTAEDPRTEPLADILAEMAAGAASQGKSEGENMWRIPDRGTAIQFAVDSARPGDVILICGKAHEQSMCFGTVEYPWDDRIAARAALSRRLGVDGPAMPRLPTSPDWKG